ncbi:Bis(5'-nucleosyl)-tetraphosphatase, symmetrical [Castellaniella defragrans]
MRRGLFGMVVWFNYRNPGNTCRRHAGNAGRPAPQEPRDIWAIGDIQGCAGALRALLARPELRDPEQELWFAGDLVNRGPDSLGALRLIRRPGAPRAIHPGEP